MLLAFIDSYKPPEPITAVQYADDESCYSSIVSAASAVQCVMYGQEWSQTNRMTLNTGKTKVIRLSLQNYTEVKPVCVAGNIIEHVTEFNFHIC